ncbi:hypothetical protein N7539_006468 [Penicillium diatomitis]|uniref:Uncharacterized protein n=1 Tax=Penicillium diatomitis TaxID=2819901 RepID=A0A9X0BSY9_9EURO|nr:uncharacterized protein N7539_006468 [Penicillium diatomitis]KAJ5483022.1 hypothetical protein N7539_006468 [Penicillium diatomitis]
MGLGLVSRHNRKERNVFQHTLNDDNHVQGNDGLAVGPLCPDRNENVQGQGRHSGRVVRMLGRCFRR